jgi:hypothetical protein
MIEGSDLLPGTVPVVASSVPNFSLKHYFTKFRTGPVTYLVSGAITCRFRLSVEV